MVLSLIFRGVAFEFRYRDREHRSLWDRGFNYGSVLATFAQGAGGSLQLTQRGPRMVSGAYRPAPATLEDLLKVLGLIGEFAESIGLQSKLLATATSLVNQTIDLGFADCDPSAVLEAVRANLDAPASTPSAG